MKSSVSRAQGLPLLVLLHHTAPRLPSLFSPPFDTAPYLTAHRLPHPSEKPCGKAYSELLESREIVFKTYRKPTTPHPSPLCLPFPPNAALRSNFGTSKRKGRRASKAEAMMMMEAATTRAQRRRSPIPSSQPPRTRGTRAMTRPPQPPTTATTRRPLPVAAKRPRPHPPAPTTTRHTAATATPTTAVGSRLWRRASPSRKGAAAEMVGLRLEAAVLVPVHRPAAAEGAQGAGPDS